MKTLPLNKVFTTYYGNKLDLNKMKICEDGENGISFVSRTARNLGISATVKKIPNIDPYNSGLITVALGGAILSSNIQPNPFYTGQNIMVLEPIKSMTFNEKVFYCICIERNKHKYSAFGREANITLKDLPIPANVPTSINKIDIEKYISMLVTNQLNSLYAI